MTTMARVRVAVEGTVEPGWEPVRDAFITNFTDRGETGAACCIYEQGRKVVDLWGGVRDRASGAAWESDTMTLVYSATKGMAAMVMALAHSRGWLDHDAPVAAYWPEFAQAGKAAITVRQLLGHQAGLFAFDEPVGWSVVADLDRLAAIMARQRPAWQPGERQAYHAISLGFYESELIRRVDPRHRTLGQVFADELAGPLGLEFYIRLPEWMPDDRLAPLVRTSPLRMVAGLPLSLVPDVINPRSVLFRSLMTNPGTNVPSDPERVFVRELEIPSGGGVGTARAIARAYGVFAGDGGELGLRAETLAALRAPAVPPRRGFHDACFKGDVRFSLGFMKPSPVWAFGGPEAFGSPGAGGSLGFADPATGIGYGYVTSRIGTKQDGDPREVALRHAMPLGRH
jgi:CubicO group peptidase (beta-lactamase class C family)